MASNATSSNSSLEKSQFGARAEPKSDVPINPNIVQSGSTILTGRKLALSFGAMLMAMLLIALDQTILGMLFSDGNLVSSNKALQRLLYPE